MSFKNPVWVWAEGAISEGRRFLFNVATMYYNMYLHREKIISTFNTTTNIGSNNIFL
jgi:hypothetical protein